MGQKLWKEEYYLQWKWGTCTPWCSGGDSQQLGKRIWNYPKCWKQKEQNYISYQGRPNPILPSRCRRLAMEEYMNTECTMNEQLTSNLYKIAEGEKREHCIGMPSIHHMFLTIILTYNDLISKLTLCII